MEFNANKWLKATNTVHDELVEKHDCGWFDGGCYTLAAAIKEVHPKLEIYYISRSAWHRDHAVVKITERLFFDADGSQTESELFEKMEKQELTKCRAIRKYWDFDEKNVFEDIKDKLVEFITM